MNNLPRYLKSIILELFKISFHVALRMFLFFTFFASTACRLTIPLYVKCRTFLKTALNEDSWR